MRRPPRARIVTPEAPVKEVKKAQTRTVTTAGPPRREPNRALKTRTKRLAAPPSARKYPASVKRGILGRVGLTLSA
ncbi:MAG: hypothetical protein RI897_1391 [Verrucomicrobiota bacterium]